MPITDTAPAADPFFEETTAAPQTPTKKEVSERFLGKNVLATFTNSRNASATDRVRVHCRVTEVGFGYGNVRVRVEPIDGDGSLWLDVRRIEEAPR